MKNESAVAVAVAVENISLKEKFPLADLEDNSKALSKFVKEIQKYRENGIIEPYHIGNNTFYCDKEILRHKDEIDDSMLFFNGSTFAVNEIDNTPRSVIVDVTPSMAFNWLVYHNNKNRGFKIPRAMAYARNMREGGWQLNPHGIIFCKDGSLADGQHRLLGVIASGVSSQFYVFSGLNESVKKVIDEGRSRSLRDVMTITDGIDTNALSFTTAKYIDKIAKEIKIDYTREEAMGLLIKYQDAIEYVDCIIKKVGDPLKNKVVQVAPLRAALAAVYYNLDDYDQYNEDIGGAEKRFEQMIYVIMRGSPKLTTDEDKCAIRLYQERVSKNGSKIGSGNQREALYDMAQGCFYHFMIRDRKTFRKSPNNRTLFPIPNLD
jgi:hypothetical protein